MKKKQKSIRVDLKLIADMIEPHSRVLDIGCGDGSLLEYLVNYRDVDGRGIELSTDGVNASISAGLPVIQGDADRDLKDYPDDVFDYAVLSQTLQAMVQPKVVLGHLLRISKRAIVSFPNFAHWKARLSLGLFGRMPISNTLPHISGTKLQIYICVQSKIFWHFVESLILKLNHKNSLVLRGGFVRYPIL